MVDLLVLAAVVLAFGLVSRRLEGTILTAPIFFVAAGAVLGPAGLDLAEFQLAGHVHCESEGRLENARCRMRCSPRRGGARHGTASLYWHWTRNDELLDRAIV